MENESWLSKPPPPCSGMKPRLNGRQRSYLRTALAENAWKQAVDI